MSPYKSKNFSSRGRKHFDHKKNTWNRKDSPINYDRPSFTETHDFPRRFITCLPLGLGPAPLENSNPNYDIPRNFYPRFHDARHDGLSSCYPNRSHYYHPRDSEADSLRFHSRNDISREETTYDFSRKWDFDASRSQVRTFEKSSPRCDFSRNHGSVLPRYEEKGSRDCEGRRSFARHEENRRYNDVPRMETVEIPRKMSPTRKRKWSVDSLRVEEEHKGKSKESMGEKMNPSNGSPNKCDGVQGNTSKVRHKDKSFEGLVTSVANPEPTKSKKSCENFKIRKVDAVRIFPKHCGGTSKEDSILKPDPTRDFSEIRDADSSRVEEKAREKYKEGPVQKVDRSNHSLTKCVDVSHQVQAKSEPFNKTGPFEDKVTSVEKYKPINSAMSNHKFKIRKVNAVREFPKHCGALAPRVTIRHNEVTLVVREEENTTIKVGNDNIKVVDMKEVMNELNVADVEKVLMNKPILPKDYEPAGNELKVPILREDYGNVANKPIPIIDLEKVSDEPISTHAPVKVTIDKSVKSLDIQKDHALDDKDGATSIQDQNQLNADERSEYDYYQDKTEKGKSSVFSSLRGSSLFDEQPEESCSEEEGYFVDPGFFNKSVLLVNEDKIKPSSLVSLDDVETVRNRKQVKETINTYDRELAKLLEANTKAVSNGNERVSHQPHTEAAMVLRRDKKCVNTEQVLGHVAGIDVGDRFRFRAQLVCIGLHRQFQAGIDYMKTKDGKILATSVVDSGRYANDSESCDILVYCGEGGNPTLAKDKQPQDQKLARGNLAMKNSMEAKTPVRVIRKTTKSVLAYYYDGLYLVTKITQERGKFGKLVYMFHLSRIMSSEPNVPLVEKLPSLVEDISQEKEKISINKVATVDEEHSPVFNYKTRKFTLLVEDISLGKEKIPINVVNIVDDEHFPVFKYITNMTYPDSCYCDIIGCDCTDCYSDSRKCRCSTKNGGEVIFDDDGGIIIKPKSKPFIYECGPSCKCPSSCKNRVSQYGIRYQLEVFKTESMGWGVRSRNYIPAGSFICEYVGELLQDDEAEQRKGNDEYLFDIDDGFTIDAAKYGNVSRFINHSCSPNLYAQNILYDHGNKRMPHVMFFAVNGIMPHQELTYDYNYKLNQVLDSNGNIKRKACHCGSRVCTGRLY